MIEQNRDQRIFEAGNHDGFVQERIFGPPHPQDIVLEPAFLLFADTVDDQHFEIGLGQGAGFGRQQRLVVMFFLVNAVAFQRNGPTPVGPCGQGPRDTVHGKGKVVETVMVQQAPQMVKSGHAGERPVGFDQGKRAEKLLYAVAILGGDLGQRLLGNSCGNFAQGGPSVRAQLGGGVIVADRVHQSSFRVVAKND